MMDLRIAPPCLSLPVIFGALRRAVGNWAGRGWLESAVAVLLYGRLGEIGQRLERMLARFAKGHRMRRVAGAGGSVGCEAGGLAVARVRLWPRGFGWLCGVGAHEAGVISGQLGVVLQHPDMVAMLAASVQARRLLRPVCRALGIAVSALGFEAGVVRRVKTRRAKKEPAEELRIKLPRGVVQAARRQTRRKSS